MNKPKKKVKKKYLYPELRARTNIRFLEVVKNVAAHKGVSMSAYINTTLFDTIAALPPHMKLPMDNS